MSHDVLALAVVYLAAALVGVPLAHRLGLGSVLGYLLAGVVIGPFGLALVGREGEHVMHVAEFGVVMMLFLVGLELKPAVLWSLRRPIFGLGGAQVALTALALAGAGVAAGLDWRPAAAAGLTLAMSSTAIVLQTLGEKALLKTPGGQASFSVLLFQDLAVIPILAVFPLLAPAATGATPGADARPGWLQAAMILGAVGAIVAAGRFVVRPVFRLLAGTRLREVFTAFALFLVTGIALLMQTVGLSAALGTFLAGVVLAESEYRHELEADLEPFKGLLLGLFFIAVGASIDFALVSRAPGAVAASVAAIMAVKLGVLAALGRAFALDRPGRWLLAFGLCQVGEFAFVLLSFGRQLGVFDASLAGVLVASTALSMMLTPLAFIALERLVLPRLTRATPARAHDAVEHADSPVVIAGFGRVGQVVGRLLRANGFAATVLDLDPGMVDVLRRLGLKVHYGDAARTDLLEAAGCGRARLFVLAIDDVAKSLEVAALVRQRWPELRVLARARNREHLYELQRLGVQEIYRETLGSALELGSAALVALGTRAHTAQRLARRWREHDERALRELGPLRAQDDRQRYFAAARRAIENAERAMREEDGRAAAGEADGAWNNESLRDEVRARAPLTGDGRAAP